MNIRENFYNKVQTLREETLDEVSRKAATSAYAAADDPGYYHPKADKILKHIERKFGAKAADNAETHAYTSHFGRGTPHKGKDSLSGGLQQYGDVKLTKSGKIPKGTQKAMKNRMDPNKWQGFGRKVGGPKGILPEENLNEMQRKSKEAMDAIMDRVSKKHDEKWEKTKEKRTKEKLKGSEKTKEEDKERNNLGKRWKRAYLAKKKLKESTEEEKRQKRLSKFVPKSKKKKLGKNAELVAGWKDEIKTVRDSMRNRNK